MRFIFKIAIGISCTWKHSIVKSMVSCFAVMYQMKIIVGIFVILLLFFFLFLFYLLLFIYMSAYLFVSIMLLFYQLKIIHISMNLSAPSICFLAIQYNLFMVI